LVGNLKSNSANSAKSDVLVSTARDLFFKFGIRRVSVEEICREAGISKMTFYKYFPNKIELVKRILTEFFTEGYREYDAIKAKDIPYSEKVRQILEFKRRQAQMISNEMFVDLTRNPLPELQEFFARERQKSIEISLRDLVEAQKKGDIRADIKPEFILYMLNKILEMSRDEKLNQHYESHEDLVNELLSFFFYGILKAKDHES